MRTIVFCWLALCLCAGLASGQERLLLVKDLQTQQPVEGVAARGGDQVFISNAQGIISLPTTIRTISLQHLSYEFADYKLNLNTDTLLFYLEPTTVQLGEVVVTAGTVTKELMQQSHAITLLDKKALALQIDVQPAMALNLVPGLFMHSGTWSTNRITIRGLGSRTPFNTNKIRAYWNNIPLTAADGESSLEDIDLSQVSQIQVIKGPNSSLYGAGLGGSILMQSQPGFKTGVQAQSTIGSFGTWRQNTGLQWQMGKSRHRLQVSRLHSDGWRDNNTYDRSNLLYTADRFTAHSESHTLLSYIHLNARIPSSLNETDFLERPQAAAANWLATRGFEEYDRLLAGHSLSRQLGNALTLQGSVYGNWRDGFELRPFNIAREQSFGLGSRNYLSWQRDQAQGLQQLSLGFEYYHEWYELALFENDNRVQGAQISDQEQGRLFYNVFGQANLRLQEAWVAEAGFNLHQTRYRRQEELGMNPKERYQTNVIFSPRLALKYLPGSQTTLYAQVAHGLSPLSPEDLNDTEGNINPEIRPETGINYEVGFRRKAQRWYMTATLYRQDIRNLLVTERTQDDRFVGKNAGRTLHQGLELSVDYNLAGSGSAWSGSVISLSSSLHHFRFREFVDEGSDFSGNVLTGVPEHQTSLALQVRHQSGFFASLVSRWVGATPIVDDNSLWFDAYFLLNAKMGYAQKAGKRFGYELSVAADNLTDTDYASMLLVNAPSFGSAAPRYFYPGAPRSVWLSVALQYYFN